MDTRSRTPRRSRLAVWMGLPTGGLSDSFQTQNRIAQQERSGDGSLWEPRAQPIKKRDQNMRENGSDYFGMDSPSRILENQPEPIEVENQNNGLSKNIFEDLAQMRETGEVLSQLAIQPQVEKRHRNECTQRFELLWGEALRWNSDFSKFVKTIYAIEDREEHFDERIQNLLQTQLLLLSERVENLQEKLGNLSREQSTRAFLEEGHFYEVVQEIAGLKQKLTSVVWSDFKENHSKRVVQSNRSVQVGPSVLFKTKEQNISSQTSNQFVCNNDDQSKTKESTPIAYGQTRDVHGQSQNFNVIAYGQTRDVHGQSQNFDVIAYGQTSKDVHGQSQNFDVIAYGQTPKDVHGQSQNFDVIAYGQTSKGVHGQPQNSDVSHTNNSVGGLLRKFLLESKNIRSNPTNTTSQSLLCPTTGQSQKSPISTEIDSSRETQFLTTEGTSVRIATPTSVFSGDVPFPLSRSDVPKWHTENVERNREKPSSYRTGVPCNHFGSDTETNPGGVIEGEQGGLRVTTDPVVMVNDTSFGLRTGPKAPDVTGKSPAKFFSEFCDVRPVESCPKKANIPAPVGGACGGAPRTESEENPLWELIRIQTRAMQQQTEVYRENLEVLRRQNELKEHEVLMKGANIQLNDLPVFDGKDGFSLVKFWKEFDRCRSIGRWTTVSALSWLKSSLRGIAAKEFDKAGPFDDFDQARQALNDRFLTDEDREVAGVQLQNLRQLQNESVRQYFEKFDELVEVAYGDMPPPGLKATFINGLLSEHAQRIIQIQRPKTLSEALRFAKEEEVIQSRPSQMKVQNQNKNFGPNSQNSSESSKMCYECYGQGYVARGCANRAAKSALPQAQNRQFFPQTLNFVPQRAGPPQDKSCYECGEFGHFVRDCIKRTQRLARRDPKACNHCGIVGHKSRDCPNKNRGNFRPPPRHF